MSETLTAAPSSDQSEDSEHWTSKRWQNVSNERIDAEKAHYMAEVEDAWRDKAKDLSKRAIEAAQSDNPMVAHFGPQALNEQARYVVEQYGPRAVEQTAKNYDELHNPILPKDGEDPMDTVRAREQHQ